MKGPQKVEYVRREKSRGEGHLLQQQMEEEVAADSCRVREGRKGMTS